MISTSDLFDELFPFLADIVFIVTDQQHPLFHREGDDLVYQPQIPLVTVSHIMIINRIIVQIIGEKVPMIGLHTF